MCAEIGEYAPALSQPTILMEPGCYRVKIKNISDVMEFFSSQTSNFFCNTSGNGEAEHTKIPILNTMNTYQFWLFAVIVIMAGVCNNSLFTMADTACYESLQKTGSDYGKQRLWGAISWGVIAPFAGFVNDYTNSYVTGWCLMGILCVLEIWNISRVDLVKPHFSQNILKDIGIVMQSKEFMLFTFGVFMNGIATGIIWFYLSYFFSDIGGNRLMIGLAHTIQCFAGELPFMFYSEWMIKKLGHFNIVTLAIFMHFLRFLWYSYFRNPWMMLPIESVHGFTYGSFYAAMTSYAKLSAKPGTEATTQSVLCTCYEGFGAGLGCVLAGISFDAYGGFNTFFYASMCCACAALINFASTVYLQRRGKTISFSSHVVT
ncbi:major facilitator superfamily domain-containing protein 6-A-like [Uloborus diversus]|uniref:major facilitator superfamily domain-containing protein 6-A-like n=1 Tax=Uloborus diversus TaxID=327109 RepID=UPI00240A1F50|nr:major facilitator superfamily domain-containing protein 6-A-like [Uloborus diversus]